MQDLIKKLQLKAGQSLLLIQAPEAVEAALKPDGFAVTAVEELPVAGTLPL
ncbi:hypothetical protein ACFSKU_17570 [Pontibacter silvestris]|uniref:Uncharacterized protein n=1 Tax=Pontibacter silvestris TaxID=2305183 RepID=A0ABW4X136_9BACT|nr:hypothetical protein [Pontibacter silvestris]MCC9135834.1 hypothetical protein [Pontibacter silvestris]